MKLLLDQNLSRRLVAALTPLYGHPPKVVWLNLGNVSNAVVAAKLLENAETIRAFLKGAEDGVLEIE
ncbi:MAG: hypothetical protein A2045_07110 [Rhodocyclales bacterium GWA2_65_20]|nr:MAG: hypothetical protein A2045_07110 [Rhodocyclales bacterium GWA2_65_20]